MRRFKNGWKMPVVTHGVPTEYGWVVMHPDQFIMARYTDIGWGCFIQAEAGVYIGTGTQIGGGTYIYSVDTQRDVRGEVHIGHNVCIGAQSLILPGVWIDDNARIPAHSIIKGDPK